MGSRNGVGSGADSVGSWNGAGSVGSRNGADSGADSVGSRSGLWSGQSGVSGLLPSQPSLLSGGQRARAGGKIPAEGF